MTANRLLALGSFLTAISQGQGYPPPGLMNTRGRIAVSGSTNRMVLQENGDLFIDGSLNPPSDHDKKENFQAIDAYEELLKSQPTSTP